MAVKNSSVNSGELWRAKRNIADPFIHRLGLCVNAVKEMTARYSLAVIKQVDLLQSGPLHAGLL